MSCIKVRTPMLKFVIDTKRKDETEHLISKD